MDRSSLRTKCASRRNSQFPVRSARRSTCWAIRIMGCPSFGGQRTHGAARIRSTDLSSSIESAFCGGKSHHRLSVLRRPAHVAILLRHPFCCRRANPRPGCTRPTAIGVLRLPAGGAASRSSGAQYEPREQITSIHPKLASGEHKLKHMSTALKSAPNLAFKRTPNGRPRSGIMFILAITRPAVWRRLTLR
jgi:hypothetical protein